MLELQRSLPGIPCSERTLGDKRPQSPGVRNGEEEPVVERAVGPPQDRNVPRVTALLPNPFPQLPRPPRALHALLQGTDCLGAQGSPRSLLLILSG